MNKKDLHPEYIKYLVRSQGMTLAALAKKYGFSSSTIKTALKKPMFFGEQIIATFLNIHPMNLWPSRYDEKGNPLHPHASANNLKPFCPKNQDVKKGGQND
ncbi:MAG: transcriptional regulator [Alphaproteobacteria bacterium]